MDEKTRQALERFLLEAKPPATLGPSNRSDSPAKSQAERNAAAMTKLLRQRQALVEGDRWRTTLPFVAIFLLAIVGIAAAMKGSASAAVAMAIAGATATMFRLLQVAEQQKGRAMIFSLIQVAAEEGKYPPTELVTLILSASKLPPPDVNPKTQSREQAQTP